MQFPNSPSSAISPPPSGLPSGAPAPELGSPSLDLPSAPAPELNSPQPPASLQQQGPPPAMASSPPPASPLQPPPSVLAPPPGPVPGAPPPVSSPPPAPIPGAPPPVSNPPPAPMPDAPPPAVAPPPLIPPPSTSPPPPSPTISPPPPSISPPVVPVSPPPQQPNPPPPPSGRPPPNVSPPPPTPDPSPSPPPPGSANPPGPQPSPPFVPPPPQSPASPTLPPPSPLTPPPSNSPPIPYPSPATGFSPPPPIVLTPPPPPPPLSPPANQSSGIGTAGTVAIAVAASVFFLGMFGIVACCVWNRRKKGSGTSGGHIIPSTFSSSPHSGSNVLKMQVSAPSNGTGSGSVATYSPHEPTGLRNSRLWFMYEDLENATDGFSAHNLLGEGGFGFVYKGILADGRTVAVKKLKDGRAQGDREFRSEVEIISRIHHRHLVSLVGCCISEERRLLVYDYLPNDTLYFHLHAEGRPVMDWTTRVKIAIGAARGIAYLHEDCHPRIIHRDIKSSNILLDDNFEARVSDFGLAKLAMDANTHVTTRVMGTFGYMAPEYASSGKLTEKSDVYSFGVVLLELISGRKPVDTSQPLGEESLVEWARPLLSHALEMEDFGELPDQKLSGNYVDVEMFRLIEVAAACIRHSSAKRPRMGQVVRAFDSMATSDLTNGMRVGESEVFNTAEQSEEIRLIRRMAFGSQNFSTDFFSRSQSSTAEHPENSGGRSETSAERSRER